MVSCGLFLSFFLGIVIVTSLLLQPENDFGPRITFGHLYSTSSVETIVDSRFKVLAANFQEQIDYLKGKFAKQSKSVNKEVFESQHGHLIKKRKTKTSYQSPPTKPPKKFENMNSNCTFFYPDYPDAGREKIKNVTFEILTDGKEAIGKKQENNKSKPIKPICVHSTPFCTFTHPDRNRAGRVNASNSTTVTTLTSDQTGQDPTDANKTPINGIDPFLGDIEALKKQGIDQSKRIDQLEQKLAMLENASPPSAALPRDNNKDKMKNGASNNIDGQVSKALTPPSSCQDLAMLEYYLDGLYLVKNKQTNTIQTVFCKFSASSKGYETIIGYNDIKTAPVSFLVTRTSTYDEISKTIPFNEEVFNLGGAMNRQTGVFTAPKNGRYFFSFKTRSNYNSDAQIFFRVNENRVLYVEGFSIYENMPISTVLDLHINDRVDCYLSSGSIGNNVGETFFSGILLEEN